MPGTFANSVSSLPRPTLSPGKNFVPRWRTRMEPPVTSSPPNRLTPRRCEFESRPLREEPCPFLCAMACLPGDRGDLHLGEGLTVTASPSPAFLLFAKVKDAPVLALAQNLADDLG